MKGLESALSRLAALPAQAQGALQSAALSSARQAAEAARNACPVRTGALRASLSAQSLDQGAQVSAARPYAALVEMGSLHRPPQPFLLPAARGSDYPRLAAQALKEVIS